MLQSRIKSIALITLFILLNYVETIPRRGREPWSVILCKLRDSNFEPRASEWFEEWILGRKNQDTIESFFYSVSNGVYSIEGSNVTTWLKLPWTRNDIFRMAQADPRLQVPEERPFALYDKAKEMCIEYAKEHGYEMQRQKITVINQEQTAIYGKSNGVLITPKLIFSSVLAHEMVHSMNIGHSYSDRQTRVFPYSSEGEYDDRYDLMSTANAHMRPSTYGLAGPGLNGPHLDYLGWLPMNRVVYFGRDGRQNYTLRLSSLSVPHKDTNGWLLIQIPYDRDDPQNVYTVELRTPEGNDRGVGQAGVVIHQVRRIGLHYFSFLVTHAHNEFNELTMGTEWVKFLHVNAVGSFQYIRIRVERLAPRSTFADIRIVSTFEPNGCLSGEVERRISPFDPFNKRHVHHVCLHGRRSIYPSDIETQYRRQKFFELRRTFGQNECIEGMEWRAIDVYDYVCVSNERANEVKVKSGNEENETNREEDCSNESVKREAFDGDTTCVSPEERVLVQKENSDNIHHLKNANFFNGVDTLNS